VVALNVYRASDVWRQVQE